MEIDDRESRAVGLLFGCAAGDSLGLPGERLGRKRWASRFPGPLRQRFLFGHGMVSDDTELSILVTQAVLSSAGDSESFLLSLSWRLRYWLLFCRAAAAGRRCAPCCGCGAESPAGRAA